MASESPLLRLPIELRLQIFDHCIVSGALTISGCILPPWWPTGIHSTSESIPGVAPDRLPIARVGFDRSLLEGRLDLKSCTCVSASVSGTSHSASHGRSGHTKSPTRTPQPPAWMLPARCSPSTQPPSLLAPTIPSLHLTCRQIHCELHEHQNPNSARGSKTHRKLDLYLSYPDGVCTVVHRYPHLLHQARTVYVAGICDLAGVKNPPQEPDDVLRNGRRRLESRYNVTALDEEQADALMALVHNVHLVGKRAVDAAKRAVDAANRATEPQENDSHSILTTSEPLRSRNSSVSSSSSLFSVTDPPSSSEPLTIDPPPPPASPFAPATASPTFYLRIFYPAYPLRRHRAPPPPRAEPHDRLWGHNLSPVSVALAAIYGGDIKFGLSRSSRGTGAEVVATGNQGHGRVVTALRPQHGFYGPSYEAQAWSWCIPHSWGVEDRGAAGEALEERAQGVDSAAEAVGSNTAIWP